MKFNSTKMNVTRLNMKQNGFALISTMVIMMLLMLVAVAMLSLSSTSTRTSASGSNLAEAKANARMALLLAIGELQKQMGSDQRISANANIFSLDASGTVVPVANPHWTGVWDSWKAGAGENSQHSTLKADDEMAATYASKRSDYFRGWLLSLNPDERDADKALNASLPVTLSMDGKAKPEFGDTAIRLVGTGSLSDDAGAEDYVSARLLSIAKPTDPSKITGRYGWWIGDENQKARLMPDSYTNGALTAADKIFRSQAPASMGNKVVPGLETISDEEHLNKLPSLKTVDLVDLNVLTVSGSPEVSQVNFHNATIHSQGVLSDVREGGLKRDLSAILERQILPEEDGQEFMLYEFDDPRFPDRSNSRVPIQDLAAYFQLYDNDPGGLNGRRGGISYDSDTIHAKSPDFDGGSKDRSKYQSAHNTLYTQPAITKVQFLLAVGAQLVTIDERNEILRLSNERNALNSDSDSTNNSRSQIEPMRDADTHKLLLGIMPVITLWNPNNVPMIVDNSQVLRFCTPPFALRWRKYRNGVTIPKDFNYFNLNYAMEGSSVTAGVGDIGWPHIVKYRFAKNSNIVFEPGEVKMFSAPANHGGTLTEIGDVTKFGKSTIDPENLWNPYGLFLAPRSTPQGAYGDEAPDAYNFNFAGGYDNRENMVFAPEDRITYEIVTETPLAGGYRDGRRITRNNGVFGAGFVLTMTDEGFVEPSWRNLDFLAHYQMLSRHGGTRSRDPNATEIEMAKFNRDLIVPAFSNGLEQIHFKDRINSLPGDQIIGASESDPPEVKGLMDFSLSYGCEVGSGSVGGFAGGRRLVSRPFLHSGLNAAPFIDKTDKQHLYNNGWDWQLNIINDIEDSIVQGEVDTDANTSTGRGYFGGGYTIEAGSTHVVQREIPVLPPISIASLSHAHLGGFSLARNNLIGTNPETDNFVINAWHPPNRIRVPQEADYQQITAFGAGGLAPHVVQAIGNSYAHPNIPADKAFRTDWERYFDADEQPVNVPFVDHSYLANKALWDEYFFSSITPKLSSVELYGGGDTESVKEVASDFFINGGNLPNRRLIPYTLGVNDDNIDEIVTSYHVYTNGFADKIASHLMVDGSFNINSTSEEAWKVLFSSLKGKPSSYLESGKTPSEDTPDGTVVGHGVLLNSAPIAADSITSPNSPPEQWKAGRELSDDDIDKLATAMVKQVKLRGPFLSLSEFINRRLDGSNEELALKGALQAAIDDPDVPINAPFREAGRMLDAETASINFEFDAAADGPVAYGSAAYVDQADILRGLASQLTPRGDTFVIRTYGDSLGKDGKVLARAWCEAVVQRVPEYIDPVDEAHVKHANLSSDENKSYGRKLKIISFRWLNANEV